MNRTLKEIIKKIIKALWKYLNKNMEVKYMALWFFMITIAVLLLINIHIRTVSVFVWYTSEESGLSNYCYNKKDVGKVCLTEKKVNEFLKTRKELK